jgi:DNA-nicking Smr family endonuclease
MFFDLNIPITAPTSLKYNINTSKKKGKQKASSGEQPEQPSLDIFTATQVEAVEKRIDVLVHCESTHNVQDSALTKHCQHQWDIPFSH